MPTEAKIRAFYDAVWKARCAGDAILIKTLLYTGVRVFELVRIRIADPGPVHWGRWRFTAAPSACSTISTACSTISSRPWTES